MDLRTSPTAETLLPDACALCGGDVHLRVRDGRATSYCGTCHWISRPRLQVHHDRLELAVDATATA